MPAQTFASSRSAGVERRKHPRLMVAVDVRFDSGSYFYGGRTRDISEGGLFVESDAHLVPGTELTVDLRIPGMHAPMAAEVVWVLIGQDGKAQGFGVRFTAMTRSQQRLIQALMLDHGQTGIELVEPDSEPDPESPPESRKGPPPLPRP